MVEIEIDGRKVEATEGSMVMHAAQQIGVYVPHFCYHKKLSIAANCRMCLVEVEKAPKPLPACATPVTPGMKVWTKSEKAVNAQKGVMEFLLINHPLDCPICDQGGECQLQDLAVGYGGSHSRYDEPKRVIFHKPMGPLISAEEMTRCIHCTRCVRFGQEVAGVMELGMAGRGEHSEIMTFVGKSVDSELSGNMIDLCPVGALTSKPYRYSARPWELARRRSVSPHDSLGSNLNVQVKGDRVMRVVPHENEAINECWISDRDRFSYEGLNAPDRLAHPMVKDDHGQWHQVDWQVALETAANSLRGARAKAGSGAGIGFLAAPSSTLEELSLVAKLARAAGSDNVDHRLRQRDFSHDAARTGAPWLGMAVADVDRLERLFVIGGLLRNDLPLLSARVRKATKRGARVALLHAIAEEALMPVAARVTAAPSRWVAALAAVARVLAAEGAAMPADVSAAVAGVDSSAFDDAARAVATSLKGSAEGLGAVWLGAGATNHDEAHVIHRLAQFIAQATGCTLGVPGEAANSVGAWIAGAVPRRDGLNARAMIEAKLPGYLLVNIEPDLDFADAPAAQAALAGADAVVALTAYTSDALLASARVLLPVGPFTETAGTFINTEGRVQGFQGVVRPLGESRPAWKVLRVLGNLLEAPGFDAIDRAEQVREDVLRGFIPAGAEVDRRTGAPIASLSAGLSNALAEGARPAAAAAGNGFERVADVPIHFVDAIVRRSPPLQATRAAKAPVASMSAATMAAAGVAAGQSVRLADAAGGSAVLVAALDDTLPQGVVRASAAHPSTAGLGAPGAVTVTPA